MHQGRHNDEYARRTMIQLEGFSPKDGYRSMGAIIRWRRGAYKILFFTIRVLQKKKWHHCNYESMRALWIHYARLFLLHPVIIPRLLWTCLRISYPKSYHAIILKWKINVFNVVSSKKKSSQCQLWDKKHQYFSIVSLPTDSVIVDHAVSIKYQAW
jgi:hypothetical protein